MSLSTTRLYQELVKSAMRLDAARLWKVYARNDCVAVRVPGEEHALYVFLLGWGGEAFGLVILRGKEAFAEALAFAGNLASEKEIGATDVLGLSLVPFRDIPPAFRRTLKKGRFTGIADSRAPQFIAKAPNEAGRTINDHEAQLLLFILNGILKAHANGTFRPVSLMEESALQRLTLSGDPVDPEVEIENQFTPLDTEEKPTAAKVEDADLAEFKKILSGPRIVELPQAPAALRSLARLDARWIAAWMAVPEEIRPQAEGERILFVADEARKLLLRAEILDSDEADEAVDNLLDTFRKNPAGVRGLPREVVFTDLAFLEAAKPLLASLGVRTALEPRNPVLAEVMESLIGDLANMMSALDEEEEEEEAPATLPAPDDREAWNLCDRVLHQRLQEDMAPDSPAFRKAAALYFGDRDTANHFLDECDDDEPAFAFYSWYAVDYRAQPGASTLAEKVRKDPTLRPGPRAVLEAEMHSTPSVFRIEESVGDDALRARDIFTDRTFVLDDVDEEHMEMIGWFVPGRTYVVGGHSVIVALGPALDEEEWEDALDTLRDEGLITQPSDLRDRPELFGRLWVLAHDDEDEEDTEESDDGEE